MKWLLGLSLASISALAPAIVIRHDRPDGDYVVRRADFPYLARVSGFAEGTLIGERWVLTAAHVAMSLNPVNGFVDVNGKRYRVKSVIFHPKGDMNREANPVDLALLYLREPVKGVEPAGLYARKDEAGKTVTFLGAGATGDGRAEPAVRDGKTRRASNVIDKVDENNIRFLFDAPPKGLADEGISGPGDSGGPAILMVKGKPFVVGVSNSNSKNPGQGHCMYGTEESYARVSAHLSWIQRAMKGLEAPNWGWKEPTSTAPKTPAADSVNAFVKAFNSGSRSEMEAFDLKYRSAAALSRRTPDERWATIEGLRAAHGSFEVKEVALSQMGSVACRMKTRTGEMALQFMFMDGALLGFTMVDLSQPIPK